MILLKIMKNSKLIYNILKIAGILSCIGFWYLLFFTNSFSTGDISLDIYALLGTFISSHAFTLLIFKLSKDDE